MTAAKPYGGAGKGGSVPLQPIHNGDACGAPDTAGDSTPLQKKAPHISNDLVPETSTLINLIKGNVGTGMLAMPFAVQHAGLYFGLFAVPILGVICVYCMHLLLVSSHELCERTQVDNLSLDGTAGAAFRTGPRPVRWLASFVTLTTKVFLVITQIGFCCVYFEFIADNLYQLIECSPAFVGITRMYFNLILIPALLLVSSIRELKNLAYVSIVSNICQLVVVGVILYYCCRSIDPMAVAQLPKVGTLSDMPLFFGTAMFAFEGIGLVMPLENKMKDPRNFGGWRGVLNTGMTLVVSLYTAIGYYGYMQYGSAVQGSITLNLPSKDPLASAAIVLVSIAIFLSYPLQLYVAIQVFLEAVVKPDDSPLAKQVKDYTLRAAVVIVTFIMAVTISNLGLFISLIGALSSTSLALILPPVVNLITFWPDTGRYHVNVIRTVALVGFGMVGFVTGTYSSTLAIIDTFRHPTNVTQVDCFS